MGRWEALGVVVLWMALTAWLVRPVPGKGVPLGRAPFRFYLDARRGLFVGTFLLIVGALVALAGLAAGQEDAFLVAFLLAWLGGLYAYHASRMRRG
jgi:hypothetical protein